MPLTHVAPASRQGIGWSIQIGPTSIILTVDDTDESAMNRAIADLQTWTVPANWTGEVIGVTADGLTKWIFDWMPL